MPTYQYACTACDHRFEAVQTFSDPALTVCPECEGRLRKVYSGVGVVFKGSGFYRTDSRSSGPGGSKPAGDRSSTSSSGAADSAAGGSAAGGSSGSGSSGSGSSGSGSSGAGSSGSGSGASGASSSGKTSTTSAA